nr:reverse transcriptase domain-containing protein [Tanacetum cinerariifolium]
MSYKEPPIPPTGVNQQEPVEVTTDTVPQNSDDIHPPIVQAEVQVDKPADEPAVDDILTAKFMEIFRDLHFELSFADALIHMPKFAPTFKKLLNNKDKLIELTKMPLNENCSAVVLKKTGRSRSFPDPLLPTLNDTKMVLELADRTISKPTGVVENVFVKVGHRSRVLLTQDLTRRRPLPESAISEEGNPKIHDVIKKEVEKLLDVGLIYPISDSPWVSPIHCVPKKGGMTVIKNDENELVPTRLVMLERLAGNEYYCFLDGFSGYLQIPIDQKTKRKPRLRILMEPLPTNACRLAYAMILEPFSVI